MKHIKNLIIDKSDKASEQDVFEALCKDVLEGLDVDLVSIWYFNDDYSSITCKYSINKTDGHALIGTKLFRADHPTYFNAIIEGVSVSADDVYSHPMTIELSEKYSKPNNILSLLDYLIIEGDRTTGLICCETTSAKRMWKEQDSDLIRVLTVMAGVELKNTHRN